MTKGYLFSFKIYIYKVLSALSVSFLIRHPFFKFCEFMHPVTGILYEIYKKNI